MTFATLKADIQSWVNRDDAEFVAKIPEFISLAEDDIYTDLRTPHNEFTVTYTTASAVDSLLNLPENFKEVRQATWNGYPMTAVSPSELSERLYWEEDTYPLWFAITERQFRTSGPLDADPANWEAGTEIKIVYWGTESLNDMPIYQTPTNPVDSAPAESTETPITQTDTNTTRLYQHFPSVYLFGSLHYAHLWLKDQASAVMYEAKFQAGMAKLKHEAKRGQFAGGRASRSNPYGG